MSIIEQAEGYVKKELANNDASHDFFHIERVVNMAKRLAADEGIQEAQQLEIITLAALLHDVHDYKYSGSESAGAIAVTEFLTGASYPSQSIDQIIYIIENLSFKNELERGSVEKVEVDPAWDKALAIVQDADRLDAIGAIGVARCMTYSGAKKRPIYDPSIPPNINISKESYMNKTDDHAINHFHEKLFKLKDLMKTESAKKIALKRHQFMELFVSQLLAEWDGNL